MLRRRNFFVFQLPNQHANLHNMTYQLQWIWLDNETITRFFSLEERFHTVFKQHIAKGFKGIVWHNGIEWASYAWISLPETAGPPHLPRFIQRLPVYWIFYCRTREKYQGRGLYKASLSILGNWARSHDPKAKVYIDTEPNNIPSRKAIEDVGFIPAGVITTWTLSIPKLGSFVISGRWDKEARHPEVSVR